MRFGWLIWQVGHIVWLGEPRGAAAAAQWRTGRIVLQGRSSGLGGEFGGRLASHLAVIRGSGFACAGLTVEEGSTVSWRGWVAQRWRSVDVAWLEVRSRRRAMSEGMARGGVEAQTREPGQTNEVGKTNEARKRALMTPSQVRRGTRGRAGSPTCSTFAFMVETRQPRPVLHRRSRSASCATRFLTPCLCFRTGRQRAEEAPECPSEGGRYHQHGRTAP